MNCFASEITFLIPEYIGQTLNMFLVKKAGRQIFDKSILMENVKPLWTSMYKACNTLKFEI